MAKIYSAPRDVGEPPDWDDFAAGEIKKLLAAEEAWEQKVISWAERFGSGDLKGYVYRWQIGDGYARYVVYKTSPLELIWLNTGDAWEMPAATARGLRTGDVRKQAEFDRRWAELGAKQRKEKEGDAEATT